MSVSSQTMTKIFIVVCEDTDHGKEKEKWENQPDF
jgi:hypothetical protein